MVNRKLKVQAQLQYCNVGPREWGAAGWKFEGSGKCASIPQLDPAHSNAVSSPKCGLQKFICLQSYMPDASLCLAESQRFA